MRGTYALGRTYRGVELDDVDSGPDRGLVGPELVGRHGDLPRRRRTATVGDRHVVAHARPVEQPTTRLAAMGNRRTSAPVLAIGGPK